MPKNVATPEQSRAAREATGMSGPGFGRASSITVDGEAQGNSVLGVRPLSRAERRVLQTKDPDIYIYNISTIFQWNPRLAGRDTVLIPKCKVGEKVSAPVTIPGAMQRDYDAGNRKRQLYVEVGTDIAEDLLGCSKEMPGMPQNDLTRYGCFYLVGTRFEELSPTEQEELLFKANDAHDQRCREKVFEADTFADNEKTRQWITEVYRQCALHLYERGDKSMMDRRWVSRRGKSVPVQECKFCGFECKKGIAKCPNCREIIDQELYDKLKGAKSPSARRQAEQPSA